eukprot:m.43200 g.43200  ORF g.43200 m.43200 type:complete len:71 (-) comp10742_c0_seq2:70-282(-)
MFLFVCLFFSFPLCLSRKRCSCCSPSLISPIYFDMLASLWNYFLLLRLLWAVLSFVLFCFVPLLDTGACV